MIRNLKIATAITDRDSLSVEKYIQEVAKIPLITMEQEVALAKRIRAGDEDAVNKLVKANLRFGISVAKQYQHQGLPLGDLLNEANLGLIKAARMFDESKGFKFISYAVWWVRQHILQALAETGKVVRLPLNKVGFNNKVFKEKQRFEQEFEREPSNEEIAEIFDVDVYSIDATEAVNKKHKSIDAPSDKDDRFSDTMADNMIDEDAAPPDMFAEKEALQHEIQQVLRTLPAVQKYIICNFFGISTEAKSLDDIANILGLTKERTRQLKEKAIVKLQKYSDIKKLKQFLR